MACRRNESFDPFINHWIIFTLSWFILIILSIYTQWLNPKYYTKNLIIIEQDPRISYPGNDYNMTAEYTLTAFGSVAIIIIAILHYSYYDSEYNNNLQRNKYLIFVISGLLIIMIASVCIAFFVNILHTSPVPSFFDQCNYQGYGDAIKSGNYTEYFSLTKFGRFGDIKYCRNAQNITYMLGDIPQNMFVFSTSTYANMILCMFRNKSIIIYCECILLSVASFGVSLYLVSVRINNHMVSTNDAILGSILGCVIGYLMYCVSRDSLERYHFGYVFKDQVERNDHQMERLIDE